jgi:hypothetical protein
MVSSRIQNLNCSPNTCAKFDFYLDLIYLWLFRPDTESRAILYLMVLRKNGRLEKNIKISIGFSCLKIISGKCFFILLAY